MIKLPDELLVGKNCADHLFLDHQNQLHQPQIAHLRLPVHYSPRQPKSETICMLRRHF